MNVAENAFLDNREYYLNFLKKKSCLKPETGCQLWIGHRNKSNGYGRTSFYLGSNEIKTISVHRLIYLLLIGEIPDGIQIRHSCHHPACINPAHLSLGTAQDNANDRSKANRQAKGQKQACAKMTEEKIREIRKLHQEGFGYRKIGAIYGINQKTVYSIVIRQTWKHVQ